jgi:hypothetical protein
MGRVNGTPSLELGHLVVIEAQRPAPSLLPLSSIVFLFFSEIMASDFGGFSELIYLFEMVLQMI